jgi:hypothetical protein
MKKIIVYLILAGIAFYFWMDAYKWETHADDLTVAVQQCVKYDGFSRCMRKLEIWATDDGTKVLLMDEVDECTKLLEDF